VAAPRKVVICGSLAHPDRIAAAALAEQAAGREVIAVPSGDDGLSPAGAAAAWREHIRAADRVVVVRKPDGTIGSSTSEERGFAIRLGREIHDWTG
jgi:hypothetical protein